LTVPRPRLARMAIQGNLLIGLLRWRGGSQCLGHRSQQHGPITRFLEMRVRSKAKSLSGCLWGWIRGHHQHGKIRAFLADRPENSETIQVWKPDVQNYSAWLTIPDCSKTVLPGGRLMHSITGALQGLRRRPSEERVVIDHQDRGWMPQPCLLSWEAPRMHPRGVLGHSIDFPLLNINIAIRYRPTEQARSAKCTKRRMTERFNPVSFTAEPSYNATRPCYANCFWDSSAFTSSSTRPKGPCTERL
jgi:hypothetical protein